MHFNFLYNKLDNMIIVTRKNVRTRKMLNLFSGEVVLPEI